MDHPVNLNILTQGQERQQSVERRVKVSELECHAHGDDDAEEDGDEPRHGEVRPVLHAVQLAQHEDDVDEHDAVAAGHAHRVEGERVRRNVAKAEIILAVFLQAE